MGNKVSEFSFYPEGSNQGRKTIFLFFVTWTTCTFTKVDNWYSRIWLSVFKRCAVRIWNFLFAPWGHMRVDQWCFLSNKACHLNSMYISNSRQTIRLGMYCRCALKFLNFYFHPWGQIRVKECFFQNLVTWSPCIFQGIVNKWYARMWLDSPCRCPIRFMKSLFASRGNIFFLNYISITWYILILIFCFIPLWRKTWPFNSTHLKPLYPRIHCAKNGWNLLDLVILKKLICEKIWIDTWTDRDRNTDRQIEA